MWPEIVSSVFHGLRLPNNSVMLPKATYLFISHMSCPVTADPLYTLLLVFSYHPFRIHSICSCLAQVGIFQL